MPDEYGVLRSDDPQDYQQFMLGLYDIIEDARNLHARADAIKLLEEARSMLINDFETKHPGYGKGRAVWR